MSARFIHCNVTVSPFVITKRPDFLRLYGAILQDNVHFLFLIVVLPTVLASVEDSDLNNYCCDIFQMVIDHCGGLSNDPSKSVQLLISNTCEVTLYCKGIAYGIKGLKMGRLLDYLGGP